MNRSIGDIELLQYRMYVYLECFNKSKNTVVQISIRRKKASLVNAGMGDRDEMDAFFCVSGELK